MPPEHFCAAQTWMDWFLPCLHDVTLQKFKPQLHLALAAAVSTQQFSKRNSEFQSGHTPKEDISRKEPSFSLCLASCRNFYNKRDRANRKWMDWGKRTGSGSAWFWNEGVGVCRRRQGVREGKEIGRTWRNWFHLVEGCKELLVRDRERQKTLGHI